MLELAQQKLQAAFPDGEITLQDYKSDGLHFVVTVKSAKFNGLKLIDQHKLVYAALAEFMQSGELHALRIKTHTTHEA